MTRLTATELLGSINDFSPAAVRTRTYTEGGEFWICISRFNPWFDPDIPDECLEFACADAGTLLRVLREGMDKMIATQYCSEDFATELRKLSEWLRKPWVWGPGRTLELERTAPEREFCGEEPLFFMGF